MNVNKSKSQRPSRFFLKLLSWFCDPRYLEDIEGDLLERFEQRVKSLGIRKAKRLFVKDVLLLIRPALIRHMGGTFRLNNYGLFKNYLTIAFRNFTRNRVNTMINVFGLAMGMGICLLIYQYINFELSYDTFHSNANNIFRTLRYDLSAGGNTNGSILDGHALRTIAKEELPEVKKSVRVTPHGNTVIFVNPDTQAHFSENLILDVDPEFLEIFDFSLTHGNPEFALKDKNNIVITEKIAIKYFGSENPIGKILNARGWAVNGAYKVAGVLEDLPTNSHLQFDFLVPLANVLETEYYTIEDHKWKARNFTTYLHVDELADLSALEKKFNELIKESDHQMKNPKIGFQPLTAIHLGPQYEGDPSAKVGKIKNIQIFTIIAIFILVIAWVNYINLSTANALNREKEVGVRKSIGAFKSQLITQFMMESVLINISSAVVAVGIAFAVLPILNNIIGMNLRLDVLHMPEFWISSSILIAFGTLLSGLYPAFVLSSFKPVSMLKANGKFGLGGFNLRKGLILFQFGISLILISGTFVVHQQIAFMTDLSNEAEMEKILVVNGPKITGLDKAAHLALQQTFKNSVKTHHTVLEASGSGRVPGKGFNQRHGRVLKLDEPNAIGESGDIVYIDRDFMETYAFDFLQQDSIPERLLSHRRAVIINEKMLDILVLGSPEDALKKELIVYKDTFKIFGVIKNFHWQSLRHAHRPYVFLVRDFNWTYYSFKINLSSTHETLAHVETTFQSMFPDSPFSFFFLDDEFNRQYRSDVQFENLLTAFSTLAIFINCLGLLALVSFSASMKTKEIGIRKVLGAGISQLMLLLSREYLLLLLVSAVIASPIVLYFGNEWLNGFAFRSSIGLEALVIPTLILLIVSMFSVSYQTFSSAKRNPVESLKLE